MTTGWWDARPDQRPPSAPPGLGAGFRGGTFRGRLVIIGGAGGGEFVYNGTFTVLQSSNCGAPTHDPILGVACPQGFATYNSHGKVINLLSTANSAFFQYLDTGAATQGSLILSVASTSGTDPVDGTAYPAGLFGVDPVFGDSLLTLGATISFGQVAYTRSADVVAKTAADNAHQPLLVVDAPEQTTASHLQMQVAGASPDGTTKLAQLIIGIVAGAATLSPATNATVEIQGTSALANKTAPSSVAGYAQPFASAGHLDYVSSDGNTYDTGRLSQITTVTTTINNTVAIPITGLSFANVAAATYRVHAMIRLTAAAAGVVQPFTVQVTGTATVSTMLLQFTQYNAEGTPTIVLGVTTALSADPTHIIGNLGNSNVATFYVDGSVTFSGAGTFGFAARSVTANGDETATAQTGNFADLMPVVA